LVIRLIKGLQALGTEFGVKYEDNFIGEVGVRDFILWLKVRVQVLLVLALKNIVFSELALNLSQVNFFYFHVFVEVNKF